MKFVSHANKHPLRLFYSPKLLLLLYPPHYPDEYAVLGLPCSWNWRGPGAEARGQPSI